MESLVDPLSRHYKKKRAVPKARRIARAYSPSKLKIHKMDGSIQDTVSYEGKTSPKEFNQSRSNRSRAQDMNRSAQKAESYLEWVMNPGKVDFGTIDNPDPWASDLKDSFVIMGKHGDEWRSASDYIPSKEEAENRMEKYQESMPMGEFEIWPRTKAKKYKQDEIRKRKKKIREIEEEKKDVKIDKKFASNYPATMIYMTRVYVDDKKKMKKWLSKDKNYGRTLDQIEKNLKKYYSDIGEYVNYKDGVREYEEYFEGGSDIKTREEKQNELIGKKMILRGGGMPANEFEVVKIADITPDHYIVRRKTPNGGTREAKRRRNNYNIIKMDKTAREKINLGKYLQTGDGKIIDAQSVGMMGSVNDGEVVLEYDQGKEEWVKP